MLVSIWTRSKTKHDVYWSIITRDLKLMCIICVWWFQRRRKEQRWWCPYLFWLLQFSFQLECWLFLPPSLHSFGHPIITCNFPVSSIILFLSSHFAFATCSLHCYLTVNTTSLHNNLNLLYALWLVSMWIIAISEQY